MEENEAPKIIIIASEKKKNLKESTYRSSARQNQLKNKDNSHNQ